MGKDEEIMELKRQVKELTNRNEELELTLQQLQETNIRISMQLDSVIEDLEAMVNE